MAISTYVVTKSAGWARTDVILQLEEAFTWLGWHGAAQTGSIIGITSYTGGGTVGSANTIYPDVRPSSTSGIGTNASFYISRSSGAISQVYVNRVGYGYTGGELITLSAEDIGGSANGASNIQFRAIVSATVNNSVGYAITFGPTSYNASGTDRNGSVSGTSTTITIKEGDTLTITNNNTFADYNVNICWKNDATANNTNRVFNVINQNATTSGGICTWTPQPGQAGTYFIEDDNYNVSGITTTTIVVLPASSSDINPVGFGTTNQFYAEDVTAGSLYPWGVLRHQIQPNKKYGDTYRGFQVYDDYRLMFLVGSGFNPVSLSNNNYLGTGTANRFTGTYLLDTVSSNPITTNRDNLSSSSVSSSTEYYNQTGSPSSSQGGDKIRYASTNSPRSHNLQLTVYRSGIDPKFAVLSYRQPTVSNSRITDNTFLTFILHNFESSLWDYDDVFLGGVTFIDPETCTATYGGTGGALNFSTYTHGNSNAGGSVSNMREYSKRTAEFGYATLRYSSSDGYSNAYGNTIINSPYLSSSVSSHSKTNEDVTYGLSLSATYTFTGYSKIYTRYSDARSTSIGTNQQNQIIDSSNNYNAVIKGIPLNSRLIPCPYYIPDDFVLIDFKYASSATNIQQGDTITISGSEVYTVITGSYNQYNETAGLLFCARTV